MKPKQRINDNLEERRGRNLDGEIDDLYDYLEGEEYGIIGKDILEHLVEDADEDRSLDKGVLDGKFRTFLDC